MKPGDARKAIEARSFDDWRGLPEGATPDELLDLPFDDSWGRMPLGDKHQPARSHLLELAGYYRPLAFARDGKVVAFDAMNPEIEGDARGLMKALGKPDETLDWVFGSVDMPGGEHVYAGRGITLFVNPENHVLVYVTLYAPTSVASYRETLRPGREKRSHTPPEQ